MNVSVSKENLNVTNYNHDYDATNGMVNGCSFHLFTNKGIVMFDNC